MHFTWKGRIFSNCLNITLIDPHLGESSVLLNNKERIGRITEKIVRETDLVKYFKQTDLHLTQAGNMFIKSVGRKN